ncbi:hypothetical protein SRIMM317S_07334 [Streptomyces rimosus subsp. rimosus]
MFPAAGNLTTTLLARPHIPTGQHRGLYPLAVPQPPRRRPGRGAGLPRGRSARRAPDGRRKGRQRRGPGAAARAVRGPRPPTAPGGRGRGRGAGEGRPPRVAALALGRRQTVRAHLLVREQHAGDPAPAPVRWTHCCRSDLERRVSNGSLDRVIAADCGHEGRASVARGCEATRQPPCWCRRRPATAVPACSPNTGSASPTPWVRCIFGSSGGAGPWPRVIWKSMGMSKSVDAASVCVVSGKSMMTRRIQVSEERLITTDWPAAP